MDDYWEDGLWREGYWGLFWETGAPEFYLLHRSRPDTAEEREVWPDPPLAPIGGR